jgi:Domain of unknown function (DUF4440)
MKPAKLISAIASLLTIGVCSAQMPAIAGAVAAPPASHGVPLMTRWGKLFLDLETQLDSALRQGQQATLDRLVDTDFAMLTAGHPGTPVPREEWLQEYAKNSARLPAFSVDSLSAREFGDLIQVSFQWRDPGNTPLFIVDVWKRDGENWLLTARYAARQPSKQPPLPGEPENRQEFRKKI